jgi:hypothetical protein
MLTIAIDPVKGAKALSVCVIMVEVGEGDGAKVGVEVGNSVGSEVAVGAGVHEAVGSTVSVAVGTAVGVVLTTTVGDGGTDCTERLRDWGAPIELQAIIIINAVSRTTNLFMKPHWEINFLIYPALSGVIIPSIMLITWQ